MRATQALLLALPLGGAVPSLAACPPQDPPPPVVLENTDRMDEEVLETVQRAVDAVNAAQAAEHADDATRIAAWAQAWADLGLAYEANTMWAQALECYEVVAGLLPEKPEWTYRIGVCRQAVGDLAGALEAYRSAAAELKNTTIVQARHGDAALLMGELEEAEAAWRQAIASETSLGEGVRFPESRVGLAQVLIELERYEEAETLLREALQIFPGYTHAHYLLGTALIEQGQEEEAAFELQRGLNAFPIFPPDPHQPRLDQWAAGYGRRMMQIENAMAGGQVEQALTALEAVRAERPDDPLVLNLMSRAHQLRGRFDQALALLEESEAADPKSYATQVDLAVVLLNMANQQQDPAQRAALMTRARECAAKGVQLAPHLGRPWYYLGLVDLMNVPQGGDPMATQQAMQGALSSLQRAQLLGCQEPQLFEQLARVYAQMGRTREMLQYAEANTARGPENPAAWMFLAQAHFTVKEYDEAVAAAERAVQVAPGDPNVQNFLAQVRQAAQQAQAAPAPADGDR